MKFKNIFKNSLFLDSLRLAKSNPHKLGLMILFDALFLASFFAFQNFFRYIAPGLSAAAAPNSIYPIILKAIFTFIYVLFALFLYSFFKYCVLDFIRSLFGPGKFSFRSLGRFYLLNIIIAGVFFVISVIAGFILVNIKEAFQPYIFILIASPYWAALNKYSVLSLHSLIFYIVLNISHSLFYDGSSAIESAKKGFVITFTKIKSYRKTVSVIILAALIFGIVFLGINYSLRPLAAKNFYLFISVNSFFQQASVIVFNIVFYIILLINRISFYKAARGYK